MQEGYKCMSPDIAIDIPSGTVQLENKIHPDMDLHFGSIKLKPLRLADSFSNVTLSTGLNLCNLC